jgi:hypothetical protein
MKDTVGRIMKEGLFGGFIAYGAVVVVLALLNAAQGRSIFYTAAAMGAVLFHGGDAAASLTLDPQPILAYNGVHLLASILVGVVAAYMVHETELYRPLWYLGLMLLVAVGLYAVVLVGVLGVEIGGVLDWTTVLVGAAAWAGAMTAYFVRVHQGLLEAIRLEVEV